MRTDNLAFYSSKNYNTYYIEKVKGIRGKKKNERLKRLYELIFRVSFELSSINLRQIQLLGTCVSHLTYYN